ncbi:MAG: iron-sulfur cluster assembly accessory protein [bacterium]|nr:iron-sulfur cluster assembly accessory protein [bacterium]
MGTFHDDKGALHGITVYAQAGDTVYVGRCDTLDDQRLVLHDADLHVEGQDGRTVDQYLQRSARFGIWKKHDTLIVPVAGLGPVRPLGELVRGGGAAAAPEATTTATAAAPAPAAASAAAAVAAASDAVSLTPGAAQEVRRLLVAEQRDGQGLRLGVAGGGCSGLVYKVEFDTRRDGDLVVPQDGFDVYLDRKSAIYLRGITVDHQAGLGGRGFQFRNPNATNTCGCGESFAV